ncbi:PhzF family phenazine biosynthesis protein [Rhodopila sp.]|uniref:PhzF family phenazine biosynthesis protein n=1 Tax=Rhodopila sp. TaxID=2480087 RepID=UPI002CD0B254|nr:PhzF family phenazine biosynthesis protein [Rhodopila sp.]HVZ07668.1 PhzF family phenazine biosynthesis protein [Rhodopila sp.]
MSSYEYVTVGVFTSKRFGGNPLAVFPDAKGLTDGEMQAIAAEFNLSETSFVLPPDNPQHHARVRIFTPKAEIPFAGHPNVGTGYVLARMLDNPPEHFTFEEGAGLVRVHVLRNDDQVICGARVSAPRALSLDIAVPIDLVARCAGLAPSDISTELHQPIVASVGTPFVIAEVASVDVLARARPDLAAFRDGARHIAELSERFNLHLYARKDDFLHLRARMFAPLIGVLEDPATGAANAALAALLTSLAPGENVDLHYEIEQGIEMGRPSQIIASARKTGEGPVLATVAGNCVPMMRGTLDI